MKARIRWVEDRTFVGEAGTGQKLVFGTAYGPDAVKPAPSPMDLVLIGTGGCAAWDVVNILTKSREAIEGCVVEVDADRAEQDPQVFTRIHMHFVLTGRRLAAHKVQRAIELSAQQLDLGEVDPRGALHPEIPLSIEVGHRTALLRERFVEPAQVREHEAEIEPRGRRHVDEAHLDGVGERYPKTRLGLLVETRLEDSHRGVAIAELRALVLAGHHDPGRDVRDANRGVGGVDALAARARRPVDVDP